MTLKMIRLADIASQPWRNGGGQTRELLAWPSPEDWTLRISVANILSDGPFSQFTDVERWLAVIEGEGLTLAFSEWPCDLRPGDDPLRFDGATAPYCRLLGGPSFDLNLMLRCGHGPNRGQGAMQTVEAGAGWSAPFVMRGLFTATPGRWSGDGQTVDLPAHTLLWADHAGQVPWTFVTDAPSPRAWWIGYTPQGHR